MLLGLTVVVMLTLAVTKVTKVYYNEFTWGAMVKSACPQTSMVLDLNTSPTTLYVKL